MSCWICLFTVRYLLSQTNVFLHKLVGQYWPYYANLWIVQIFYLIEFFNCNAMSDNFVINVKFEEVFETFWKAFYANHKAHCWKKLFL